MPRRLMTVGTSLLAIVAATRTVPEMWSPAAIYRQLSCSGHLSTRYRRATTFAGPGYPLNRRRARPRWHGQSRFVSDSRRYSAVQVLQPMRSTAFQSTMSDTWPDTDGGATSAKGRNKGILKPLTPDQLPDESIYILDGTAMLFKAFYGRGASGYLAADGATEVGAVLAMGIEFAQFINEVKPRYVAMAFDVGRETFRRDIYPGYKAQRKPHPVDLTLQVPLARALAEALGCRTFALEGFEADDVMATLARWARSVGLGVVVCSSDKDMCQLVRDRVHIMQPGRDGYVVLGDEEVRFKYGVRAKSLPDFFGLVGDRVDNIPGVKGIGRKRGSRLLERFGSLEGIFEGVEGVGEMDIRGSKAIQELLSKPEVQDEALLYREVATLHDEVPLDGVEDLKSSFLLYKGVAPEAENVMKILGFSAPLRIIQQGNPRLPPFTVDVDPFHAS